MAVIAPVIKAPDGFFWEGRLAVGQSIEISNLYGSIHAEPAQGDCAWVTAEPGAQVAVVRTAQGITIRAIEPTLAGSAHPSDFTVYVPKGVHFVGRTVNGSVEAKSLQGDAAGYTVNGDVRISSSGESRARTVNGSIQAQLGAARTGPLEFSSVNGGITLEVPRGLDATLRASTGYGSILSDCPLARGSHDGGQDASGDLGHGGPELRLTTINGSIRLRIL